MAASVIEQILARAATVLSAAAIVAPGRIYRDRSDAFAASDLPAINLRRGNASIEPQDVSNTTVRVAAEFDVEFCASGTGGMATVVDAMHVAAQSALMDDATLAALGHSSLSCSGVDVRVDAADHEAVCLTANYTIAAWALQRDLSTPI